MVWYLGWIMIFCFWDEKGWSMCGNWYCRSLGAVLDSVLYHTIDSRSVPLGYTSVTVRVVGSGRRRVEVMIVAGSLGTKFESKESEGVREGGGIV